MRYKNLNEQSEFAQTIKQLGDIGKKDPDKLPGISKIIQKIKDIINKATGQENESVQEQSLAVTVDQSISDILGIEALVPDALKQNLKKQMLQIIKREVKQQKDADYTKRLQQDTALAQKLEKLAGKVTGSLEVLDAHYEEAKKKGDKPKNVQAPEQNKMRNDIREILDGMIKTYERQEKTQEQKNKLQKLIMDFVQDSIQGIVPLGDMIALGSGNVKDEVAKTKYKPLVDIGLIDSLLTKMPSGTGGNWGPGELGLAIVGSPVFKGDKGDIVVGGEKIEIKASKSAKQGGRLTPDDLRGNGTDGKLDFIQAFKTFIKSIKIHGRDKPIQVNKDGTAFMYRTAKGQFTKGQSTANFGETLITAINAGIKAKGKVPRKETVKFVQSAILAAIKPEFSKKVVKMFNANDYVESNGQIDYTSLKVGIVTLLGQLYYENKQVDKILVINPTSSNFEVISTQNAKVMGQKIRNNQVVIGTTLLDFQNTQQKASPQIGVA